MFYLILTIAILLAVVVCDCVHCKRLKKKYDSVVNVSLMYSDMLKEKNELKELTRLIPIECLRQISKVLEHGAKKYSPNGWKTDTRATDLNIFFINKAQGHVCKYFWGNRNSSGVHEEESDCHHLAHAVVNLMFAHWHDINKPKEKK